MSEFDARPPKPSRRGYILLIAAVVVVIAGWSAAWLYGRSVLGNRIDWHLRALVSRDVEVDCSDQGITGYPFRYEVRCSDLSVRGPAATAASLGSLTAVALVYNPFHVILEARSPARVAMPLRGLDGVLDFDTARASVKFSREGLRALDAVLAAPALSPPALSHGGDRASRGPAADKVELHLREAPDQAGTLEAFLTADRLIPADPAVPGPIGLRAHARLEDGMAVMAGIDPLDLLVNQGSLPLQLVEADLTLPSGRASATGDLTLSVDGTLSGSLNITLADAAALLHSLRGLFPPDGQTYGLLEGMVSGMEQSAPEQDGVTKVTIPVRVIGGRVMIGFLPVGTIPPLFPAGV